MIGITIALTMATVRVTLVAADTFKRAVQRRLGQDV